MMDGWIERDGFLFADNLRENHRENIQPSFWTLDEMESETDLGSHGSIFFLAIIIGIIIIVLVVQAVSLSFTWIPPTNGGNTVRSLLVILTKNQNTRMRKMLGKSIYKRTSLVLKDRRAINGYLQAQKNANQHLVVLSVRPSSFWLTNWHTHSPSFFFSVLFLCGSLLVSL